MERKIRTTPPQHLNYQVPTPALPRQLAGCFVRLLIFLASHVSSTQIHRQCSYHSSLLTIHSYDQKHQQYFIVPFRFLSVYLPVPLTVAANLLNLNHQQIFIPNLQLIITFLLVKLKVAHSQLKLFMQLFIQQLLFMFQLMQ